MADEESSDQPRNEKDTGGDLRQETESVTNNLGTDQDNNTIIIKDDGNEFVHAIPETDDVFDSDSAASRSEPIQPLHETTDVQQSSTKHDDGENGEPKTLKAIEEEKKQKKPKHKQPKSTRDEELIRIALHRNPYFTCMDEEQIEKFIEAAEYRSFRPGEAIILEGCRDDRGLEGVSHENPSPIVERTLADTDDLLDIEFVDDTLNDNPRQYSTDDTSLHSLDYVPPPSSGSESCLYVIRNGNVDVFYDTVNNASLGPGNVFGEGGFLFGRQHSASIVAGGPVECWVVDYCSFSNQVLPSDNLKGLFSEYAKQRDSKGKLYMTMEEFVHSCLRNDNNPDLAASTGGRLAIADAYQNILRTFATTTSSRTTNRMYLSDFCLFHMLMARPDPEVDIAFILMDRHRSGTITLADFNDYLSNLPYFDRQAEFVQRHFGQGRVIRSYQFSQFLQDLQREMGRQAFLYRAKEIQSQGQVKHKGFLPPKEFIEVLKSTCGWRLPDGVVDRLNSLYCKGAIESAESTALASVRAGTKKGQSPEQITDYSTRSVMKEIENREKRLGTRYFTYVDFLAFQDVLGQLPGICNLIERACEIKKGSISPDDFKVANRVLGLGGRLSQRQVDIIFQLFDLDRDGFLSAEDAVSVCGEEYACRLEPVPGRNGQYTFAPPPNYPKSKSDEESKLADTVAENSPSSKDEHIVGRILNQAIHFLMSSFAGGLGIVSVYPLDLVKTRMMNQRIGADGSRLYLQSFDCLRKAFQFEGFFGLYRGLLPPLLAVGPEKTIKFAVNDLLRGIWSKDDGTISTRSSTWFMEALSGGCAGACQLLVTNPLEITKIRMQLQGETSRLLAMKGYQVPKRMSFSEIAANLGMSGLYRGATACLLRDIPFGAIYFPVYSLCKDYLVSQRGSSASTSASELLLAGTLAALPASLLTTPADMVKTRLQAVPRPGEASYVGIGDCIKTIYVNEGPTAFFKGSLFRVCRIAPQFGISLLAYEKMSHLVGFMPPHSNPPTNAPVDPSDYRTAFPTTAINTKTSDIDNLVRNMRLVNPQSPTKGTAESSGRETQQ